MNLAGYGDGDSFPSYAPATTNQPKKSRLAGSFQEASVDTASMASTSTSTSNPTAVTSTRSKTAEEIRTIVDALDFEQVARYFDRDAEDEIDPYVVCDGVSVAAFNAYTDDDEDLRIGLRFLDLLSTGTGSDDGRLVIVELPTRVHESTAEKFKGKFIRATGNPDEVAEGGSTTARRHGNRNKEADATFGPMQHTPHQRQPPANRAVVDWVTLAVEVGRTQPWASLEDAARWWCNYAGIEYILLLKISAKGFQMRYALYEITAPGILPAPTVSGKFRRHSAAGPAVPVTFDMHRILAIPADQPLPDGVNQNAVVDLRTVMNLVFRSI